MSDDKNLHVYIENVTNLPEFFLYTPERFESVAKKFSAARDKIEVRIGYDGEGIVDGLKWADILVGREFPTRDFGLPPFTGSTCLYQLVKSLTH